MGPFCGFCCVFVVAAGPGPEIAGIHNNWPIIFQLFSPEIACLAQIALKVCYFV
jgi:hypothetical protein